jgi:hypothetical protein
MSGRSNPRSVRTTDVGCRLTVTPMLPMSATRLSRLVCCEPQQVANHFYYTLARAEALRAVLPCRGKAPDPDPQRVG